MNLTSCLVESHRTLVAELEAERSLVVANRELARRCAQKLQTKLARPRLAVARI